MTEVEIEHVVPCGRRGNAQTVQRRLREGFGETLDRLAHVQGEGVFEVRVTGETVLDGQEQGSEREALLGRVPHKVDPEEGSA